MISKELLSEVLGSPITILCFDEVKCEIRNSITFENYQLGVSYSYLYGNKETRFMPIHELAHTCKVWALDNDAFINSNLLIDRVSGACASYSVYSNEENCVSCGEPEVAKNFFADSEPEAVFAACEWIRKQL